MASLPTVPGPDRATVASIFSDVHDDPYNNRAVRIAHQILSQVPGAAFEGEPFMLTGLGVFNGQEVVVCSCFYHSVAFVGKTALIYSRKEGGMIPWVDVEGFAMPHFEYLDCHAPIGDGVSAQLLSYVREQMNSSSPSIAAEVTQSEDSEDEAYVATPAM